MIDNAQKNPRSGIALVMVLGVLSLMILLAVSFAVSMRTERVAAANYVDTVRGRQLVHAALARAMNEISLDQGVSLADPGGLAYPDWVVMTSYTNAVTNVPVDFLRGFASNFVPRALWAKALATNSLSTNNTDNNPHWIRIKSVVNNRTNLMGRSAYMILNCSGLLDANFAGGLQLPALRNFGTNAVELALDRLPELAGADFINQRNAYVRYETLEELNELGLSPGQFASNLFVFSHAPAGYWSNAVPVTNSAVARQVNLSGERDDLLGRKPQIIDAFARCDGINAAQAGILFTNLVNYVEDGNVPIDEHRDPSFNSPATKPVGMVNALAIRNELVNNGGTINSSTKVFVELWNPFVDTDETLFKAELSGRILIKVDPDVRLDDNGTWTSAGDIETDTGPGPGQPVKGQVELDQLNVPLVAGEVVQVIVTNATVTIISGPATFDQVVNLSFLVTNSVPADGDTLESSLVGWECLDPRFNWDVENTDHWQWQDEDVKLDEINAWTLDYWSAGGCDTNPVMHVAKSPLRSVGELGYLAYAPWQTIKLYGPDLHPVVDYFGLADDPAAVYAEDVRRGCINPNTSITNALAVLFHEMPIDESIDPPDAPDETVSGQQATNTADFIVTRWVDDGPYTNVSDVFRLLDWDGHFNDDYSGIIINELQREAFIRNTVGLLSTRQQMYTILLEVHVASAGNIPRRPSRQRAVAIVWRDGWTGEMFVRSLKLLPD